MISQGNIIRTGIILCGLVAGALLPGRAGAQSLVVCSEASPDALNPQYTTANTSYDVAAQIYDRLVGVERGGSQLIPGLAESWNVSADGLDYTFKLRPGVKWHSSRLFTPTKTVNADDVVFSYTRMMDESHPFYKVGGTNYNYFDSYFRANLKAVEKIDDMTVRFTLKQPQAPFLGAISVEPMSILSKDYADAMMKAGTPEMINSNPIGTGPFSFVAYQKDASVRFRAFPDHWGKAASLTDRTAQVSDLVFVITPDPAVRLFKVKSGECHIARYPNPGDLPSIRAEPGLNLLSGTIADMSYLAFNHEKKPFVDKRVREALVYATNIPAIVEAVYQGTGKQTAAQVPPTLWGHRGDIQPRPYDPAKAKALLADAGFPNGFKTTLWAIPVVRAYMPNGRRAAELIQADWAKVGVEAQIVSYEWGEYLKRARMGEHDIAMLGGTWDYPDPSQLVIGWTCEGIKLGSSRSRWCNRDYSDLIAKANAITDQAERAKLYGRAQEIFQEDAAGLLFANAQAFTPIRKEVSGYKMHFFGGQPFYGVSIAK